MKPLTPTTVYIPISVRNRLPEYAGEYFAETTLVDKIVVSYNEDYETGVPSFSGDLRGDAANPETVTNWLEEKPNHYVLSREELSKLIIDTWDTCSNCLEEISKNGRPITQPYLPDYINQILNND